MANTIWMAGIICVMLVFIVLGLVGLKNTGGEGDEG